jgi:phosphohistidine phosphatase
MHLLFVRHAAAEPAGKHGLADSDRPLTEAGAQKFRTVTRPLAKLIDKPRAIFSSPLLRARQTADILAKAWRGIDVDILPGLADGDWPAIWDTACNFSDEDTIVLVGHEDWLSNLTAELLGGTVGSAFAYRKGGLALLEVGRKTKDRATLVWFLPARVLRRLD